MLSHLKISTRLTIAFVMMLVLLSAIGGTGYWGVSRLNRLLDDVTSVDAKLVEFAQRSRTNMNIYRRYEKDLFLNIDDEKKMEEYLKKFHDNDERFHQRMEAMAKLVETPKDKEAIAEIGKLIQEYSGGFDKVYEQIRPRPSGLHRKGTRQLLLTSPPPIKLRKWSWTLPPRWISG